MTFLKEILMCNGYPHSFIEMCVKKYMDKVHSKSENLEVYGPEKKTVLLRLPFLGIHSAKLKRQIIRLVAAVSPWINLRVVFVPIYKLSRLSHLKCKYPLLSQSGVVYRVNCSNCEEFYVGMTTRRLEQRLKEHCSSDCSALKRHAMDTSHTIDYVLPTIVASDQDRTRLYIKESLKIRELQAYLSLNGNVGSNELKLW